MAQQPPIPPEPQPLGPIERFPQVDSTSEVAMRAWQEGHASHGHVFVAETQTEGRGRRGNRWHSSPGEGLFLSAIWQPKRPLSGPLLTMASGLAVFRALATIGCQDLRLKWPNDVHHETGKLAGVLVESRGLDPKAPTYVVGIGINVLQKAFPVELEAERAVTSLAKIGVEISVRAVEEGLLLAMSELWYTAEHHPDSLDAAFLDATGWQNGEVEITRGQAPIRGRIESLSSEKGMQLIDLSGATHIVPLEQVRSLTPNPGKPAG